MYYKANSKQSQLIVQTRLAHSFIPPCVYRCFYEFYSIIEAFLISSLNFYFVRKLNFLCIELGPSVANPTIVNYYNSQL